jgi:uncharacterized protein YktA (UPF0223 family)
MVLKLKNNYKGFKVILRYKTISKILVRQYVQQRETLN